MYLTRIKIRNFRSLTDVEIKLSDYTALVGLNDSGKSNVLRALNLFFNGQTDVGRQLLFEQDFSQRPLGRANRAKQIEVELEFQPPRHYTDNAPVIWKKAWRAETVSPFSEELRVLGGAPFSRRSRTDYWIRQIAFEYVPAIRGQEFFATLKRRLHNTLAATIAPRLSAASGSFLGNIREEIKGIEKEAKRLFGLTTEFSLPNDLGSLFEILDLKTADSHAATPLQNRGDGIQGRHIPVILRFLAEQRKSNYARGKPPAETIWGYEEPENNLELGKQVEEANEFLNRSSSIQVLLTTHSPAFYGIAKEGVGGSIWYATRGEGRTKLHNSATPEVVDEGLGLMAFVQPYLKQAISEREAFRKEMKILHAQSLHQERPILCVEGETDKVLLEAACKQILGEDLPFEVVGKPGWGAGTGWAVSYSTARAVLPDLTHKTALLVDADTAGQHASDLLTKHLEAIGKTGKVKLFKVGRANAEGALRTALKSGLSFGVAIEELCGPAAWSTAESKQWTIERDDLVRLNAAKLGISESFAQLLDRKLNDAECRRLIRFRIDPLKKVPFAKMVVAQINEGQVPPDLRALAEEVCAYFS